MSEETSSHEELVREVQELRAQTKEQEDQLLRARAERENLRKRGAREMDDVRKFALQSFIREMLPVKDSLEQGLEAAATGAEEETEALREGIKLTLREWSNLLANAGVEEIYPLGQPFDPDLHEALSVRHDPGAKPNTIVEVAQKGYLLNRRLIRAARVIVAGGGEDSGSAVA